MSENRDLCLEPLDLLLHLFQGSLQLEVILCLESLIPFLDYLGLLLDYLGLLLDYLGLLLDYLGLLLDYLGLFLDSLFDLFLYIYVLICNILCSFRDLRQ